MEELLYRILCGYITYNPGILLKIVSPSIEIRYKSCLVYDKVYSKAKNQNILSEEEVYKLMRERNIWTESDEKNFNLLPKHIEAFKLDLFNNITSPSVQNRIRPYLNRAKETYQKLLVKKHMYDYITVEGIAHFAKWQYIISKSTYRGKKRWNWGKGNTYEALNIYYSKLLSEEDIRKVARSPIWDSMFSKRDIFGKPMIELTTDQQRLLSWSNIYQSVYEQADYPPKLLIEDDDVFDGWLLHNMKKRDQLNPEKVLPNKIASSNEIFIKANTPEDVALINSMNSPKAKENIKERLEILKKEGEVAYHKFKDVQMRKFEK